MKKTIYCDGSCPKNGTTEACGGWCWVEVVDTHKPIIEQTLKDLNCGMFFPDKKKPNTNIRMELMAIIEGLASIKDPSEVDLYSDSAYVINGIKEAWYRKWFASGLNSLGVEPKNLDLWKLLVNQVNRHKVNPIFIKGHTGHRWQELADSLAAKKAREAEAIST